MTFKLFTTLAGSAAVLLLTGCSSEDTPSSVIESDKKIVFNVTGESMSGKMSSDMAEQSAPSQCTLHAWINTGNHTSSYLDSEQLMRNPNGSWSQNSAFCVWPIDSNLSFVAYEGDNGSFNHNPLNPEFKNYTISHDVARQPDLVYASVEQASEKEGAVNLHFRHALSQVVFRTSVSNPYMEIKFNSISLCNLYDKGTFSIPSDSRSSASWLDADNSSAARKKGQWTNLSASGAEYTLQLENSDIINSTVGLKTLKTESFNGIVTLMPQVKASYAAGNREDGVYLKVNCTIYNNPDGKPEHRVAIHSGDTYMPLEINWQPGTRYVYNLNFGNGQAGLKDLRTGESTLAPIQITCSVDDFTE